MGVGEANMGTDYNFAFLLKKHSSVIFCFEGKCVCF